MAENSNNAATSHFKNGHSPTKQTHLFSKAKRFVTPNPECPNVFYTFESQLSKRKTNFGFGKKLDFTKTQDITPASDAYRHKSIFQDKKSGLSFAVGRDQSPDKSYLIPQINRHPGVGQYEVPIIKRQSAKFTIRSKTIDVIEKHRSSREVPGPGQYQSVELEPRSGRFQVSKFKDCSFSKINPKSARFQQIKQSPGPSTYREGDSLNLNSKYVLSQHQGKGTRPFTRESKFMCDYWKINQNPGPGQYQKPSQFGIYADQRSLRKLYKSIQK